MENNENLAPLRQCYCVVCRGAWVNTKTYYSHSNLSIKSAGQPSIIPESLFDENEYIQKRYQKPLYAGSDITLIDAVFEHMYVFSVNNGMSKSALSQALKCEKSHLPQPNVLPTSYREVKKLIKPLLMPVETYDACINDCVLYREQFNHFESCPECSEPRKNNKLPQKTFTYMPIGPRLVRWFGTNNLCKLLYDGRVKTTDALRDFTDGSLYSEWYSPGKVFSDCQQEKTVPFAMFTNGVNPNKHMSTTKSMWPIMLTWINLPIEIRQLLGPMLLVGIVPSGKNGTEPKLDCYMDRLVEELLKLSEYPLYSAYDKAPVTVKVALLQYLCDIPAFSKLLHISGHGALRSCAYCKEQGTYCKELHKTVHLSNRRFLPEGHSLRTAKGFPSNTTENRLKPAVMTTNEERTLREIYDNKPNQNQKLNLQRETGIRGTHPFMKLQYYDRLEQMQPDGMHTIADFISHIMDMLVAKEENIKKTRFAEKEFVRFESIWLPEDENEENEPKKKKQKLAKSKDSTTLNTPLTPWNLTKQQIKEADRRASSIKYPEELNITAGPHFTKPWTLRTMNCKLQFVKSGAFEWCIEGMLPYTQESTLFKVFDVIKRLICPELAKDAIPKLQADTHVALSLFERDFPVAQQNLVTHLIHHIVDGLMENGPLYGRWLFPYEPANGWITRQALQKVNQEATIMETYVIYDWCVYMFLSGKLSPPMTDDNSIHQAAAFVKKTLEGNSIDKSASLGNKSIIEITEKEMEVMAKFYQSKFNYPVNLIKSTATKCTSIKVKNQSAKVVKYNSVEHSGRNSKGSVVAIKDGTQKLGVVSYLLEHCLHTEKHYWAVVEVFKNCKCINGRWLAETVVDCKMLYPISCLSNPLVTDCKNGHIFVLNDF